MSAKEGASLLVVRGLIKNYPGGCALRGVDLTLERGEVLALGGESGAGKSTLLRTLNGVLIPNAGTISVEGRRLQSGSPRAARRAGIATVEQQPLLVPSLNVPENIFLGQGLGALGFPSRQREHRRAAEIFAELGVDMNLQTPCGRLSAGQRQFVAIARALVANARILLLDEPTAALKLVEADQLLAIVAKLKARGLGLIYCSQRLEESSGLVDRVAILRDGALVAERPGVDVTRRPFDEEMSGQKTSDRFPPRSATIGGVLLTVRDLSRRPAVQDFALRLRAGEVVALTGLVGSGRTAAARLIFGADRRDFGEIRRGRRAVQIRGPRDAIEAGIGLLTEDRQLQGLVLAHSTQWNFGLPNLGRYSRLGFVQRARELRNLRRYCDTLRIKNCDPDQRALHLSNGQRQKILIAKWLARECDVLIFDEPTRGVDAVARGEIYQLMNDLAARGKGILMISSEPAEVIGMADRILVMRAGRIVGEIDDVATTSPREIMELAGA